MPNLPPLFPSPLVIPPPEPAAAASEAAAFVQRMVQAPRSTSAIPEPVAGESSPPVETTAPVADAQMPAPVMEPLPAESNPAASSPPSPEGSAAARGDELLARIVANPVLLAGGALLAGVAIGRLLGSSTSAGSRSAEEIADHILKKVRQTDGAPVPPPPAADPVSKLIEDLRPQVGKTLENITKMLADLFRK